MSVFFGAGTGDKDRVSPTETGPQDPLGVLLAMLTRPLQDFGVAPKQEVSSKYEQRSFTPEGRVVPTMSTDQLNRARIF